MNRSFLSKKHIPIILIVTGVSVMLLSFEIWKKPEPFSFAEISFFSFQYAGPWGKDSVKYRLEAADGGYTVSIRKDWGAEDTFAVEEAFLQQLADLLNEYDVASWNGFDKNAPDVKDGGDFSITIRNAQQERLDASGYEMWPAQFKEVKQELDSLFMGLYEDPS